MRVFIFEFVTGGGCFRTPGTPLPSGSLLREGAAMLAAVAEDFARRSDTSEVTVLRDARLPPLGVDRGWQTVLVNGAEMLGGRLAQLARQADRVLVIAPEFDQQLLEITRLVEHVGGVLISPPSEVIFWASDKHATCQRLEAASIPTCAGELVDSLEGFTSQLGYPQVVKPRWGAGSEGVRRLESPADWSHMDAVRSGLRVESFYPGRAASVALLCGPSPPVALPPCWQQLSEDGNFAYRGGSLIQDAGLIQRALRLSRCVAPLLQAAVGYVGLDLLLGETEQEDRVVEINPRLTSSYIGIRRAVAENLADGMLAVSAGDPFDWTWRDRTVTFSTSNGDLDADLSPR